MNDPIISLKYFTVYVGICPNMLWICTICKSDWKKKIILVTPLHSKTGPERALFYACPGRVIKNVKVPVATVLPAVSVTDTWMTDS